MHYFKLLDVSSATKSVFWLVLLNTPPAILALPAQAKLAQHGVNTG
jgi:hypothetical protein